MKNIQLSSINNGGAEIAASIINECIQEKNIFDSKIILDVDSEIKRKLFWFSFFQKSNTKKIKRYLRRNLNKLQSSPNPIKHSLSILQSFFDQYFNNSENNFECLDDSCLISNLARLIPKHLVLLIKSNKSPLAIFSF